MDKFSLQKLRDLPIEEVAQQLGLVVERHRCLCCFHPDHRPSLTFDQRRNSYRCYSCGAHGGVIDLTMHLRGCSFLDACQWLASAFCVIITPDASGLTAHSSLLTTHSPSVPVPVPRQTIPDSPIQSSPLRGDRGGPGPHPLTPYFLNPHLSPQAEQFLFGQRRLNPAVVRFCRLNSYRDWLQIPYYDAEWRLLGVQRRYMGTDPEQPRFRFERGQRCQLYCQQVLPMLSPGEPLWIGEGPSDVWALLSAGHKAIGVPSATLLKPSDLTLLAMLRPLDTTLHIYPDRDAAGDALYHKLLSAANELGLCLIRHELPEGCKDFSDSYSRGGAD